VLDHPGLHRTAERVRQDLGRFLRRMGTHVSLPRGRVLLQVDRLRGTRALRRQHTSFTPSVVCFRTAPGEHVSVTPVRAFSREDSVSET
jgi:hypothetical protein